VSASSKSSAERMRRLRERKRDGLVTVPQFWITPSGINKLIARGWLDPSAATDQEKIGEAVRALIENTLTPHVVRPANSMPRRCRLRRAISLITLGKL
jgi:hypothetical protein